LIEMVCLAVRQAPRHGVGAEKGHYLPERKDRYDGTVYGIEY